jgi:hypothetical protein
MHHRRMPTKHSASIVLRDGMVGAGGVQNVLLGGFKTTQVNPHVHGVRMEKRRITTTPCANFVLREGMVGAGIVKIVQKELCLHQIRHRVYCVSVLSSIILADDVMQGNFNPNTSRPAVRFVPSGNIKMSRDKWSVRPVQVVNTKMPRVKRTVQTVGTAMNTMLTEPGVPPASQERLMLTQGGYVRIVPLGNSKMSRLYLRVYPVLKGL